VTPPNPLPIASGGDPVRALWSIADVLRGDGVSALEYIEQLTFLIWIKLESERRHRPLNPLDAPGDDRWEQLRAASRHDQPRVYEAILSDLGHSPNTVGGIFWKAQNRLPDPALRRLIDLVDQHNWSGGASAPPGAVFEGLLARVAADTKTGAGQYFTPRPLIEAVVECVQPTVDDTIIDPACGTGGFLIKSFEYLIEHFPRGATPAQRARLNEGILFGNELVEDTARLASANLLLHGAVPPTNRRPSVVVGDALIAPPEQHASLVLTAPPFGSSSLSADYGYGRYDFWTATKNKQLNFLQHVFSLLTTGGRAAIVVTDNVLFERGAGAEIRRRLLHDCDVHTMLRLPAGVFYASGVRASVLFFDKPLRQPDGKPSTGRLWVYDMRAGRPSVTKTAPLTEADYLDFVAAYRPGRPRAERVESSVFRPFDVDELLARDGFNLDLRAEPRNVAEPASEPEANLHQLAEEIAGELRSALEEITALADALRALGPQRDRPTDSAR
jgi:type I restriction enzyme M protein